MKTIRGAMLLGGLLAAVSPAQANERHFTFTYESATLPQGTRELEIWTTNRVGREDRYNRFDNRLEFEVGLTDHLQTAFYINTEALLAGEGAATTSYYAFTGVSSEWKYKLSDATADAVGSALYGEVTYGPAELELELKLILDKRAGALLWAVNVVLEQEWEDLGGENLTEQIGELDLALAWFFSERFSLGAEAYAHAERAEGEFEHVSFFVGPAVAWSDKAMWVALSVLTQIGATGGHIKGFEADLHEHERVNARLLLGFDF